MDGPALYHGIQIAQKDLNRSFAMSHSCIRLALSKQ